MSWLDDLLFPRRCPVCLDIVTPRGAWICDTCEGRLRRIGQPRCFRCGRQLIHTEEEYCESCTKGSRSFAEGIVGWSYDSIPVRRLIHEVKYHNHRQLLDYPCREMALAYADRIRSWGIECLIPVPLHPVRQRKRGFNQSLEIAKRLAAVWELPVDSRLLYRVKKTAPQKELGEAARIRNLADAFSADKTRAKRYARAALVDDIYTTGSTMEACTRVLKAGGIGTVYSIALSGGRGG